MQTGKIMGVCLLLFMPITLLAQSQIPGSITLYNDILGYTEIILFITSIISVKQFFIPGDTNRTLFQLFNLLFIIVYHIAAITHIINFKAFYSGFENLTPLECIIHFFTLKDPVILAKRLVWIAFIINLLYIKKYGKAYIHQG